MLDDTIAAISTPLGEGGIGIIRISGPQAVDIAAKIFRPAKQQKWQQKNFQLIYGHVYDPDALIVVDEVLLSIMRAPHTYTKEDIIEINCHGGIIPLQKTLELVLRMGARMAEPGEFTKRAFLNGRLDLAQAESVIDVIRASTESALRLAMGQLSGALSQKLNEIQQELLSLTALIEANIDFPEDEVDEYNPAQIRGRIGQLISAVEELLKSADTGKIYREGVSTVIAGKPNVGKSSLLNVLLREKRAIVTDIPGTTRDLIEEILNIGGLPIKIIDTAGIRETRDIIEQMGVQKTRESINKADLIILVFDATAGYEDEDRRIVELVREKKGVKVLNKVDIVDDEEMRKLLHEVLPGWPLVEISALLETGIEKLEKTIVRLVTGGRDIPRNGAIISNVRHKNQLQKALDHLRQAEQAIREGATLDLLAVDIRAAWEAVGEITGTVVTENILDKIFADFCIGK